jgi:hypothetical protein
MNWVEPRYDKHQFAGKRTKAVSARKTKTGWDTTGIAFGDFQNMHVARRENVQERRLCTPKWAVRDEWLRELLVVYLEERFYVRGSQLLTLGERLQRARDAAIADAPKKREHVHRMVHDQAVLARTRNADMTDEKAYQTWAEMHDGQQTFDPSYAREWIAKKRLYDLDIQIQNLDTDLCLTARGHAEVIASIVYLYYRLGWDSVAVAEQLQLKPPHVRQVLARLHATWTDSLACRFKEVPKVEETKIEEPEDASIFDCLC